MLEIQLDMEEGVEKGVVVDLETNSAREPLGSESDVKMEDVAAVDKDVGAVDTLTSDGEFLLATATSLDCVVEQLGSVTAKESNVMEKKVKLLSSFVASLLAMSFSRNEAESSNVISEVATPSTLEDGDVTTAMDGGVTTTLEDGGATSALEGGATTALEGGATTALATPPPEVSVDTTSSPFGNDLAVSI